MPHDLHAARKDAHLNLAAEPQAQSRRSTGLERVTLQHQALPELALSEIDVTADLFGRRFTMPLMIGAMTGGSARGDRLNLALAEAAAAENVPLALGSQRAALAAYADGAAAAELRRFAPDAFILGNLGGTQLAKPGGLDLALRAIAAVRADAMMVHLNPLQEAVQPGGDTDWRGVTAAVADLVAAGGVPVCVKEVGAGLSATAITALYDAGVRTVELAGAGGTNWTRIEQQRREAAAAFAPFLDWGIPTLQALQAVQQHRAAWPGLAVIGSGGLRDGLDVAKTVWLGADFTAAAQPFLQAGLDKPHDAAVAAIRATLAVWRNQLALACFLTGSADMAALRVAPGEIG